MVQRHLGAISEYVLRCFNLRHWQSRDDFFCIPMNTIPPIGATVRRIELPSNGLAVVAAVDNSGLEPMLLLTYPDGKQGWWSLDSVEAAAAAPAPNWDRFKRIAMASDALNQILVDAYQSAPVAAGALAPALMRAETDNELADFVTAWGLIVQAANVSPQVLAGFVGVATACHLPADFIAALQPLPN